MALCVKIDATFPSYSFAIIVIINAISADPHLEDKQETSSHLASQSDCCETLINYPEVTVLKSNPGNEALRQKGDMSRFL